jgi:hypothetical protein
VKKYKNTASSIGRATKGGIRTNGMFTFAQKEMIKPKIFDPEPVIGEMEGPEPENVFDSVRTSRAG